MTSLFFIRFIKTFLVATPFLTMTLMVLALWGVGGKTTYTDLNPIKQQIEISEGEAKNYLVKGVKSNEQPSAELEKQEIVIEENTTTKKNPIPKKIVWGLIV